MLFDTYRFWNSGRGASLGKPVLVLRETTERQEAVIAGTAKLIGTNSEKILYEVNQLLNNKITCKKMSQSKNPFGDGKQAR